MSRIVNFKIAMSFLAAISIFLIYAEASIAGQRIEGNVTKTFSLKKIKVGENFIAKNSKGYSLSCIANKGKPLKFVVKDPHGKLLPTTVVSASKTTCWACGVEADGSRHCWVVPCPVIKGPWIPGKLQMMQ